MEKLPAQDGYEEEFVETFQLAGEVVVPYIVAETFVGSLDKTSAYISQLIVKYDLHKLGGRQVITGGRYTPEHGHHYWVRAQDM